MPLFPKKVSKEESSPPLNNKIIENGPQILNPNEDVNEKQKLIFHCQQAQGSPTGVISGFSNVKELYQRISECYDFDPSEVSRQYTKKKFIFDHYEKTCAS